MNPPRPHGTPDTPQRPAKKAAPVNPPGFLATQDLKERGWTPALITRFLGEHDGTRPNGLKMGRRRLPPVKLYAKARVLDVERQDSFLAAQARAADARDRAARAREIREQRRALLLEAAAGSYRPVIHPEPLRRGAVRKAREPYLPALSAALGRVAQEVGGVTDRERSHLQRLLRGRLDHALACTYDWYPAPGSQSEQDSGQTTRPSAATATAKASDWRAWDWD
ncbi:hypothetical protein [Deinococcus sp.]|uniref:hypothetical protein n=1 Tax=Deinococcus sp. TaxID=47478 RepID=UPI0025C435F8|nr:hypothetical protein [Deinococcus sp.]